MSDRSLIDSPTGGIPAPDHTARNRLVISLLLVSAFVVILNETIMGVALPELMTDLDITASVGQWLTTAFMLTMAVVIPITGFLLQRFSTRTVFFAAMGLFSLGTLLSAVAPGFGMLVVGRVVQASGTAIMMPLLMTTVMTLVPATARGRTMGNISIVMSVAPAIGPTISGAILSFLDWRWMFILVLPIAVSALLLGAARIQNVSEPRKAPIDAVSVVLSALAFSGLIYGLSSIAEATRGHEIVPVWVPLSVGSIALAGFIGRQIALQRADRALLDLRVFASRTFSVSIGIMAIGMVAMFGTLIVLPIYLQSVLQLEPLATGLMLLPGSLLMGLLGPVVGRIYDRHGPRVLLLPGTVLASAVLWSMTLLGSTTPPLLVVLVHVGLCLGLALMFTPLFTSALGSLQPRLYSHGSAVIGTSQQLAGALGTALFITVLSVATASTLADGGTDLRSIEEGTRAAFRSGAIASLFAVAGGFLVRRPTASPSETPSGSRQDAPTTTDSSERPPATTANDADSPAIETR